MSDCEEGGAHTVEEFTDGETRCTKCCRAWVPLDALWTLRAEVERLKASSDAYEHQRNTAMDIKNRYLSERDEARAALTAARTDLGYAISSHGHAEEEAASLRATLAEREAEIERLRAEQDGLLSQEDERHIHSVWKKKLATARAEALEDAAKWMNDNAYIYGPGDDPAGDAMLSELAGLPECGGSRCFKSDDGTKTIHSSKSYSTCRALADTKEGGSP